MSRHQLNITGRMVYRIRMFFLGRIFVSNLLCTLNPKTLKT